MDRIGIVQLRELVKKAKEITGLDLKLPGDPIPPHRLNCGGIRIASGTATELAKALDIFLAGVTVARNEVVAQCLAQGLNNEPPHVVVNIREPYEFFSNTRGLVVVVLDENAETDQIEVNPVRRLDEIEGYWQPGTSQVLESQGISEG